MSLIILIFQLPPPTFGKSCLEKCKDIFKFKTFFFIDIIKIDNGLAEDLMTDKWLDHCQLGLTFYDYKSNGDIII